MEVQKEFIKKIISEVEDARSSEGKRVALSFDPVHQTHNNENGRLWQLKGKENTKKILSNTGRRRLNVLGAVDMVTHEIVPLITEANCNKETVKLFLDQIRTHYPAAEKIAVFLDNARYQRNYDVQQYAENIGIVLEFLPPYSPNLSLVERLWKFFKGKVVRNRYYPTFDEFYDAVCHFFKNWDAWKPQLASLLTLNFEII